MNWLKDKFKRKKKKPTNTKNILSRIEGERLTSTELKRWLADDTTLKFVRLLKLHRKDCLDSLVATPPVADNIKLILGRCKGYDDIIELIEEIAKNEEDIEIVIEQYLSNLTTKL